MGQDIENEEMQKWKRDSLGHLVQGCQEGVVGDMIKIHYMHL